MVDQEPGANQNMKQFTSIEKIDTGILCALEFTSSVSVLLLAFGLIASMANVLTKGLLGLIKHGTAFATHS